MIVCGPKACTLSVYFYKVWVARLWQRREMYLRFIWIGSACIFGRCCILAEESEISTIKRLFSTYLDKMVQGV